MLRDCAAAWDEALRGEDTILRFGGEEFLVVLPDCGAGDATEILERLRAATPDGQTCSAGLAVWRPGESVDELVGRADKALYEAKETGRDRLVSARWRLVEAGRPPPHNWGGSSGVACRPLGPGTMLVVADDATERAGFGGARRDPELTVLEGFHALKHALRFGAEVETAVATDPARAGGLAADLAPDLAGRFAAVVETVDADDAGRAGAAGAADRGRRDRPAQARRPGVRRSPIRARRRSSCSSSRGTWGTSAPA